MYKVYQRSREGYVLFNQCALELFQKYIQHAGEYEAGGILLGCYRGPHIEIVSATPPGPDDIRAPFSFIRKCTSHKEEALKQWTQSDNTITYMGEWHTHPQSIPQPSPTDYTNWQRYLPNCDTIICIQGTTGLWVGENSANIKKAQTIRIIQQ